MKIQNRLLALLLTMALSVGVLASCNNIVPPVDETKKPDYTANVEIKFSSEDDKMKEAVAAMSSSAVILSKGEDISVVTTSVSDKANISESYLLSNGMLFHSLSAKIGDSQMESLRRARLGDTVREQVITSIGKGATINVKDFATVKNEEADDLTVYTCSEIFDESKASLVKIMSVKMANIGASVDISDVQLVVESRDGLTAKTTLTTDYVIALGGESYSVTMTVTTTYDYESEISIKFPGDTGAYELVELPEIIG